MSHQAISFGTLAMKDLSLTEPAAPKRKETFIEVPKEVAIEVERIVLQEDKRRVTKLQQYILKQRLKIAELKNATIPLREEMCEDREVLTRGEVKFLCVYFAILQFVILTITLIIGVIK